jgi:nucleoid DNA-binding protein
MGRALVVVKGKLVAAVAKDTGIEASAVSFVYETLFAVMKKNLEKGNAIRLSGIGDISLCDMKATRSNMTGTMIPKHKRLKFNPNVRLAYKIRTETREKAINT